MSEGPCDVLIVEDKTADLEIILRALQKGGITERIGVARDGVEALDFVFCQGTHNLRTAADAPRVILLDLKLPKMNGFEVLQHLKRDPRTRSIPVVVLTASKERSDLDAIRSLGVEGYVIKPADVLGLTEALRNATKGTVAGGKGAAFPFHGGTETILAVEDEILFGAEVAGYLRRIGYKVLTASSAAAALAIWKEQKASISVLLTDIDLAGKMDGNHIARVISADDPDLPVIFLSSSQPSADPGRLINQGVNFLAKPVDITAIAQAIRAALDAPLRERTR